MVQQNAPIQHSGLADFFIQRPIFATVLAIIVMLAGIISIFSLPIEQYPDIAPPAIAVSATYPGASAKAVEDSVTQIIEQQMTGIDNLKYIKADSSANGTMTMTLVFEAGTDPDTAQVQVQNKLSLATPLLPEEVQRQGTLVTKSRTGFLMIMALTTEDGSLTATALADYMANNIQEPISRVSGVGKATLFGSQYAMRIWLNPLLVASFGLSTQDVVNAIRAQNAQVTAGQIGAAPAVPGQQLNASISVQSLMETPQEFRAIALKTLDDGSQVTLGDVATVEVGESSYSRFVQYKGVPTAGLAIELSTGANALRTAAAVRAEVESLTQYLPPKMQVVYPFDTTPFVRESINGVITTLVEAALFVTLIMLFFLQNFRATAIIMITVPVVLLGTMAILLAFGFSINSLTMLAMVLAIGLLIDDAIVVIENVYRVMEEDGLAPLEATRVAMSQVTSALIGIGVVLCAVFVPMAFFVGSAGEIYRQFSITIVAAISLSVTVAIVLTPALCATLLKPLKEQTTPAVGSWRYRLALPFRVFDRVLDAGAKQHLRGVHYMLARSARFMILFVTLSAVAFFAFTRIQQAFLPSEDQGYFYIQATLPAGATLERTYAVLDQVKTFFREEESDTVEGYFTVAGFSFAGSGQNAGIGFIRLKDWSERPDEADRSTAVAERTSLAFEAIRDARVFAFAPAPVPGLGTSNGFDLYLQDRAGLGHDALMAARGSLIRKTEQSALLADVRANGLDDVPQLKIDINYKKAQAMGLNPDLVNATFRAATGEIYVNDYLDRGRVKKVYLSTDAPYRMAPEGLKYWSIPNAKGEMVSFSSFATTRWTYGPAKLERYNGVPAIQILGAAAPGASSGAAMQEMERLIAELPTGIGFEWSGVSIEEISSGNQAPLLYALSILVVFLCLAALYESWSVPFAVMLVVPLGLMGAVAATLLTGLENDIFFQVGLLTTIGLSAKNAILIVEFAKTLQEQGRTALEAAIEASRVRLRPILMTSLAFGFGVVPLVLGSGAGSAGRLAIGAAVLGGMLAATLLGIFFTPLFFVFTRRFRSNT